MLYRTRTGNYYLFIDGRVTCFPHNLYKEPAYGFEKQKGLTFRTSIGWWHTTPVVQTITDPDELILVA